MDESDVIAAVFDFDGTMVDSDQALVEPFLRLGVTREQISFGHAIAPECERLGISIEQYVQAYDTSSVQPFAGIEELVSRLGRWAICSNKHPQSGQSELARLGWRPEVAMFADSFDWHHKELGPILAELDLSADQVVMVGDSTGDAECASQVGCRIVWAGWNPRVLQARPDGVILGSPGELLARFPGLGD